jgi:homoserine dehydrogenase
LATGDEVIEITGALSGTFGAIFSSVADGTAFSDAVADAKAMGYTEPDPRDDLSGLDVARKALILARTMGREIDLDEIRVQSLVPDSLATGSVDEFLGGLHISNDEIGPQAIRARLDNAALKYVATVRPEGEIEVGLRPVPTSTVLGALQGPENVVSFRTKRYDDYPTVVSGPGAGADVTAAGMIADALSLTLDML